MSSTTLREGARWLVIGGLLGVGFLIPLFWWLSVIGVALVLHQFTHARHYRRLVFGVVLAWWVKYLLALTWFWSTYPIEWLPVGSDAPQRLLIFFYWSTAALWLALGALVVVGMWFLLERMAGRIAAAVRLAVVPLLWVWGEIAGSFIFSLLTYGPGGTVNIKFSFGYVGYLLTEHTLGVQLAQWGGVYILTVCVVVLGLAVYGVWQHARGRWLVPALLLLIVSSSGVVSLVLPTTSSDDYVVYAIDTSFPVRTVTTDESARREQLQTAVERALKDNPDYVLLPEDARLIPPVSSVAEEEARLKSTFPQNASYLIDSGTANGVLSATVHSPSAAAVTLDKRYLVPQGEYTPTLYRLGLELVGQKSTVAYIESSRGYQLGDAQSQRSLPAQAPAVLFCFESVDPLAVQTVLDEHQSAPFVAHVISHSWFHTPEQLWRQLDQMLRVQALWSGTYIVSAGNQVTGALYTPTGAVVRQSPVAEGDEWRIRAVRIPRSS